MNNYLQDLKLGGRPMTKNEIKKRDIMEIIMELIKEIDRVYYEECSCNEGSLDYDYIMSILDRLIKKL